MKNSFYFILTLLVMSCSQASKTTTVSGTVKGLQKGTLYLQKVADKGFVTLDSLVMNSATDFELGCDLEEAEMLFLSLSKDLNAKRISFFCRQGADQNKYDFETIQV